MSRDVSIRHPARGGIAARPAHPSPIRDRLALEAETVREAGYLHNVGGVDRPLTEVPLGFGEDALLGVNVVETRGE